MEKIDFEAWLPKSDIFGVFFGFTDISCLSQADKEQKMTSKTKNKFFYFLNFLHV